MVARRSAQIGSARSLHDVILEGFLHPYWLVGGTLLDNHWTIQLGDPEMDAPTIIDFDQPITPWPDIKSLIDPRFELDLITIKIVLVFALKPKPLGWIKTGASLSHTLGSHIDFVRWRADRGVISNSLLNAAWFNEFDAAMKAQSREGLLNLTSRAERIVKALENHDLELPRDERHDVAGDAFAKLLGVSRGASITSASRYFIERYFNERNIRYTRKARERQNPISVKEVNVDTSAARYYKVWHDLWRLREHLAHDPIGFRAFRGSQHVFEHARKHFPKATRTEDVPAYQASWLINSSLALLLDPVSDHLIDLVLAGVDSEGNLRDEQLLKRCNQRLTNLGYPALPRHYHLYKGRRGKELSLFEMVFHVLPVAARIVTAAFSARRDDEVSKCPIDCIVTDGQNETWLICKINKNLKRLDRIPVPTSVGVAIRLVQRVRSLGNKASKRLYDFSCPIRKQGVRFVTRYLIDKISAYFKVPLLDDGSVWKFRPHQFRKFFGITYFWRWAFPNLTALTYHYRHFNPETTRGYIEMEASEGLRMRDEKLAASARDRLTERKTDFESSKPAFVLWVLKGVANGDTLDGTLGRRITAQVEALRTQFLPEIQITGGQTSSPSFDRALSDLVATTSLRVHPEGHSLCGWGSGPDGISNHRCAARCLELRRELTGQSSADAAGPDFAYAEDTGCLVCPLRAALTTMAPRWEKEVQKAELALSQAEADQAPIIRRRIELMREYA